jgi:hypothetical protein
MLEKLGSQRMVEETLNVKRVTRAMTLYQFVLAMVLALDVGFSQLHHPRFLEREPMLVGILIWSLGTAYVGVAALLQHGNLAAAEHDC